MPGFLVHMGATVMCMHGGQAMPTAPNPRVMVGGQPIVTITAPYTVAGYAFVPPAGNGPCVTAQWVVGSHARAGRRRARRGPVEPGHLHAAPAHRCKSW